MGASYCARARAGTRRFLCTILLLSIVCAVAPAALGQAWVPPAGVGTVSFSTQWISNTGHRLSDGSIRTGAESLNRALYFETEYAFTDRISVAVGVPYVFSRYSGKSAPPPIFAFLPSDQCRCWSSGWQDFGVTARYNVLGGNRGKFALTPSIAFGVPSHDYPFRGEAVVGANKREVRFAVDAGERLDFISRRLSVQGRYSYALAERILNISTNRSNVDLQPGLQLPRRLYSYGLFSWQRTHGGLRLGAPNTSLLPPGELNTPERRVQGDRLRRVNYFNLGAGASYQLPHVDVFGSYVAYASGTDTHAGRAFTVGVSWPFELSAFHKRP